MGGGTVTAANAAAGKSMETYQTLEVRYRQIVSAWTCVRRGRWYRNRGLWICRVYCMAAIQPDCMLVTTSINSEFVRDVYVANRQSAGAAILVVCVRW